MKYFLTFIILFFYFNAAYVQSSIHPHHATLVESSGSDLHPDHIAAVFESPAAVRAAEWVSHINSYDPSSAKAWISEVVSMNTPASTLNFLASVRHSTGGFEVQDIVVDSPTVARVIFRAALTGAWAEEVVTVEAEPPHRIVNLQRRGMQPPAEHLPKREFTTSEAVTELDIYIRSLTEAELFSGAVMVVQHGEVVFRNAYGLASREFDVPNRVDTRFIIGSINKMFTATGILQLVELGRISLDDHVQRFLPGVLAEDIAQKVQIRHLLMHTSGLDDFIFIPEVRNQRTSFRTIEDYLPVVAKETLRFEPGTEWRYSNSGYLILGAIIEKVSGQTYDDYVAEHVFGPAGMTATGAPELDTIPRGLASTYDRQFHNGELLFRSDRYTQVIRGTPAGGGFSTLTDLWRFMEALRSHRLLSPEMTGHMLRAYPELNSPSYGLGAQIFGGGQSVGHTGGGPGTSAIAELDFEHDLITVIIANQNTGMSDIRIRARQLFGAGPQLHSW